MLGFTVRRVRVRVRRVRDSDGVRITGVRVRVRVGVRVCLVFFATRHLYPHESFWNFANALGFNVKMSKWQR